MDAANNTTSFNQSLASICCWRKQTVDQLLKGQDIFGQLLKGQDIFGQLLKGQDIFGQLLKGQDIFGQLLKGQSIFGQLLKGQSILSWEIGPARLPLLTIIVMKPATAAAMKHILALYVEQVY